MVETGGLENRCTGNRTRGSNPCPSAIESAGFAHSSPLPRQSCDQRLKTPSKDVEISLIYAGAFTALRDSKAIEKQRLSCYSRPSSLIFSAQSSSYITRNVTEDPES